MLQSMGLQRVGYDRANVLNCRISDIYLRNFSFHYFKQKSFYDGTLFAIPLCVPKSKEKRIKI